MDIKAIRAEMKTAIDAGKALLAKADTEGRELTEGENAELKRQLGIATDCKNRIERAAEDASTRDALKAIGDDIAASTRPVRVGQHPVVKASGGTDWGETVLRSVSGATGFKGLLESGSIPLTVPLKPEPIRMGVPVLALRQLIPAVQGPANFGYMRQTVRTNNAAPVARGAKKPTSTYTWKRVDDRTRTIAHMSEPLRRQDLRDAPSLERMIDLEMRLGVELALEAQIINGSGSGENMTGIANVSGSQSQAWDTDLLTTLRKAKTKLEVSNWLDGAAYVVHPNDWETVELLANNEADYYLGGPVQTVEVSSRRVWGLPVVSTSSQTAGTAHLVNFGVATELQIAENIELTWRDTVYDPDALGEGVGASDYELNLLRFRAEMDAGLKIFQPSAIVEVDLSE
ncbi:hypothetical protein GCM10011583_57640 [Streptomyces camponoticapitis]|uniref:Phage capsid-like C-terminal domain-containing protein n=1 Tax=Streptomyces camponoticapitis TaxID=1616125 RepID=A0ABQ2ER62_9ACTN|nr:phage major capsid protein [Streptomyces camponoticapitis]GGK18232.1 hypothetical protein GCM10011583_57640 [Streptomyces camponoticapitis]